MAKYKFTWQKEEDVNDYKAWAECMNFHVDEIISENPKALFWATIQYIRDIYKCCGKMSPSLVATMRAAK